MSIYDLSKNPHIQLPEAEIFIQVHFKQIKTLKFFQNQAPQIKNPVNNKIDINKIKSPTKSTTYKRVVCVQIWGNPRITSTRAIILVQGMPIFP